MEMTKDSIHLFVNGYAAHADRRPVRGRTRRKAGDNRLPDFWFQQGVRPYFTSWINGGQHTPTRWHWDRVAVNPHDGSGQLTRAVRVAELLSGHASQHMR